MPPLVTLAEAKHADADVRDCNGGGGRLMAMNRKKRRMMLIGVGAGLMTIAAVLVSVAFKDSIGVLCNAHRIAGRATHTGPALAHWRHGC